MCFDHRSGNGHPLWLKTHPPAPRTATAVDRLLAAGAHMVGKTRSDEMGYSLDGENVHYETSIRRRSIAFRVDPQAGSAAAVAGELVDFALGADCGGSVQLPASYCGIFGIRTSYGLVPAEGVVKLAPGFDTIGWFARHCRDDAANRRGTSASRSIVAGSRPSYERATRAPRP
jgi:amidase